MRVQSNSRRVFGLFVRTVSRIDVGDVVFDESSSRAFERSAEADDHQQEDGISDHHLVRRIAAYDFVSMQSEPG
jgi:hypothetical protein